MQVAITPREYSFCILSYYNVVYGESFDDKHSIYNKLGLMEEDKHVYLRAEGDDLPGSPPWNPKIRPERVLRIHSLK